MARIDSTRLATIKQNISESNGDLSREDFTYEDMYHVLRRDLATLVKDAELMVEVIESVKEVVHYAEDADSLLCVAEMVGTNCEPDKDIDED